MQLCLLLSQHSHSSCKKATTKREAVLGEEVSLPLSYKATTQTDRLNQRQRQTHREKDFPDSPMCYTLLHSTAEGGKRDEPSGGRQSDYEKQREKQRVAVTEEKERGVEES